MVDFKMPEMTMPTSEGRFGNMMIPMNDEPTIGDYLAGFGGNLKKAATNPILLGELAQAVMGGSPEGQGSWQSQVGKVAANLGRSSIAAKEAKSQQERDRAWRQSIMALLNGEFEVPTTADGMAGPTKVTRTRGPDGNIDIKISGMPSTDRSKLAGKTQSSNEGMRRLLPFYLASMSSGQDVDLSGLSTEQIGNIVAQRGEADKVRNQSLGAVYQAMTQSALADYYDRLPQEKQDRVKTLVPGKDGNWHVVYIDGTTEDTGILAPDRELMFGSGRAANQYRLIPDGKGGFVHAIVDPYTGKPIAPGPVPEGAGVPGPSPQQKFDVESWESLAQAEAFIAENPRGETAIGAMGFANRTLPDDSTYFYHYDPKWLGKDVTRIQLPTFDGEPLTMGRVRKDALEKGIPMEEALRRLYEAKNKR